MRMYNTSLEQKTQNESFSKGKNILELIQNNTNKREGFKESSFKKFSEPDLVILINGMWWWRNKRGGTKKHYEADGGTFITSLASHMRDNKVRIYDGAGIGKGLTPFVRAVANFFPGARRKRGYRIGKREAPEIFRNLKPGETIKFVTSSYGDAYERGFSKALKEYEKIYNQYVDEQNKYNQELGIPDRLKKKYAIIEFVVSMSSFQGKYLGKDINALKHYFMRAGKKERIFGLGSNFPASYNGAKIRGAKEITFKDGSPTMYDHCATCDQSGGMDLMPQGAVDIRKLEEDIEIIEEVETKKKK